MCEFEIMLESADNSVQIREMYDIELILREIAVKIQIYHQMLALSRKEVHTI